MILRYTTRCWLLDLLHGCEHGFLPRPDGVWFPCQASNVQGASWHNFGIAPENAWHFGFAAAAVGMFLGLVVFIARGMLMGDAGARPSTPANQEEANRRKMIVTVGGLPSPQIIGLGYGLYATGNLPSGRGH